MAFQENVQAEEDMDGSTKDSFKEVQPIQEFEPVIDWNGKTKIM